MLQMVVNKWQEKVVTPFLNEGDRWVCWSPFGIIIGIVLTDGYRLRTRFEIIIGLIGGILYALKTILQGGYKLKKVSLFFCWPSRQFLLDVVPYGCV